MKVHVSKKIKLREICLIVKLINSVINILCKTRITLPSSCHKTRVPIIKLIERTNLINTTSSINFKDKFSIQVCSLPSTIWYNMNFTLFIITTKNPQRYWYTNLRRRNIVVHKYTIFLYSFYVIHHHHITKNPHPDTIFT